MVALILGALFAGVVVAGGFAASSTTFPGQGIYQVGTDVPAGTYRSRGGLGCYWARLSALADDFDHRLASASPSGPTLVTLEPTDLAFYTRGCATWTSSLVRITRSKTRFGEGTFIVGTDIAPGTYRSTGGTACTWARLRAFTGDRGAIIVSKKTSRPTNVTISSVDRGFQSVGCGVWSRS